MTGRGHMEPAPRLPKSARGTGSGPEPTGTRFVNVSPRVPGDRHDLREATRAEPGCLACHCCRDARDPDALLFLERWRSRDDFERHVRGDRFRTLLSVVELSAREPELNFDEIGVSSDIDYIERVMGLHQGPGGTS